MAMPLMRVLRLHGKTLPTPSVEHKLLLLHRGATKMRIKPKGYKAKKVPVIAELRQISDWRLLSLASKTIGERQLAAKLPADNLINA